MADRRRRGRLSDDAGELRRSVDCPQKLESLMERFYAFGGFGAILAILGIWRVVANLLFLARSTAAKGNFVKWDVEEAGKVGGPGSKDGRRSYRPIVVFKASDGSEHRAIGAMYSQAYHGIHAEVKLAALGHPPAT
jgi:hypothetical protein